MRAIFFFFTIFISYLCSVGVNLPNTSFDGHLISVADNRALFISSETDAPEANDQLLEQDNADSQRNEFMEQFQRFFGLRNGDDNDSTHMPDTEGRGAGCAVTDEQLQQFFDQYEMM